MNTKFNQIHHILLLTILVIVSSCVSPYKTIYIETAKPSSFMLPEDIQSLTLMNRSITDEFKNYARDSIQRYFYSQKFKVNAIILDSLAADTTLKVLGELLYESGRYDVVIPEERDIYRGLRFYKIPLELNWKYVKNICELYETDALLVLERYYNKLSTEYKIEGYSYTGDEILAASIDSKYDAVVKIYDPKKEQILKTMVISDTIYWYNDGLTQQEVLKNVPMIKDALIQTGIRVALDIDDNLSPDWITEQRGFFGIENKSDSIDSYINNADWKSAYTYWEAFANSANKAVRSKAEFNLALASEMLGEIDQAIEWAKKSYYSQYRKQTEEYLVKLGKRKKLLSKFEELSKPH